MNTKMPKLISSMKKYNIIVELKSLGSCELKYVSCGDMEEFNKLLLEEISDNTFVLKVLFHQLVSPEIEFSQFKSIPVSELKGLAEIFVKTQKHIFMHLKDTNDFFKDFRHALQTYHNKQNEDRQKKMEMALREDQEKMLYLREVALPFMNILNKEHIRIANMIEESLKPYMEIAKQSKMQIDRILHLQNDHRKSEFLLQHGWVISPYLSNKSIRAKLNSDEIFEKSNREINKIYREFFTENNYLELENMIKSWEERAVFRSRIDIFQDCLVILKTFRQKTRNNRINPARIIIPVLIAQVDGITSEYAKRKGLLPNGTIWSTEEGVKIKEGKFHSIWQSTSFGDYSEAFVITLLEKYLFSGAYLSGQIDPKRYQEHPTKVKYRPFFQFSRHKIMHGEYLRYGEIDNVLRIFLIIDFLSHLE